MNIYTDYLGIDISKETFDVVNKAGNHSSFNNDSKSFSKFTIVNADLPAQPFRQAGMQLKWLLKCSAQKTHFN